MSTAASLKKQRKVGALLADGAWRTAEEIARETGIGAGTVDLLYDMEKMGGVESEFKRGQYQYRDPAAAGCLKPAPPADNPQPATLQDQVLAVMAAKETPDEVTAVFLVSQINGYTKKQIHNCLQRLVSTGKIVKCGTGRFTLSGRAGQRPAPAAAETEHDGPREIPIRTITGAKPMPEPAQSVQAAPPTPAAVREEDDTVAVPFLAVAANAHERPALEDPVKIGGFSDGTFEISRDNGRWKMTLTRGQMLEVVGFVQKFIEMEGA